jgi:hypothetical protein
VEEVSLSKSIAIFHEEDEPLKEETEREKYSKSKVLSSGLWGCHNYRQSTPLMKSIMITMGCGLVVKLRRGECNRLIGHPKDRGKNRPNSRMNSLQHWENDVVGNMRKLAPTSFNK